MSSLTFSQGCVIVVFIISETLSFQRENKSHSCFFPPLIKNIYLKIHHTSHPFKVYNLLDFCVFYQNFKVVVIHM